MAIHREIKVCVACGTAYVPSKHEKCLCHGMNPEDISKEKSDREGLALDIITYVVTAIRNGAKAEQIHEVINGYLLQYRGFLLRHERLKK